MPRTVFIYEFITGGGLLGLAEDPPSGSLLVEGSAMLAAIAKDFAHIPDTKVTTLCDMRLKHEPRMADVFAISQTHFASSPAEHDGLLSQRANESDTTFIIAPEFDGHLLRIADLITAAGGNILGPDRETMRWASNKNLTAEKLAAANIPFPAAYDAQSEQAFPVVAKLVDGAGSESIQRCDSSIELKNLLARPENKSIDFRIESYCPGTAVSVALLLGPKKTIALPMCTQDLSDDGKFSYRGGRVLPQSHLADRARKLAFKVAPLLHGTGYVGVDMVIPETDQITDGWVIEVNPRLTTSYVGLRTATDLNLAEVMWQIADGATVPPTGLVFANREVAFSADGSVEEAQYP